MPLFITEYSGMPFDKNGLTISAGNEPAVANQRLSGISGSSQQSAAFNEQTTFVMIHTSEIVCLKFGPNPTAVATEHRLAANETRFYGVVPGQKVAVIQGT